MVEAMDIKGDFQKTEIGKYPIDWNIKELSVILKSTQLGGNYQNSDLNEEYVLIKMGNLGRGFIDLKKMFYIKSGTIPQQIDKINYGDILFNTRNTLDLVGKVAIWKDELPLAFFNSNIMRLMFKDEEISSNFFMNYILNTPKSLHQLRGIATGTTSVAAIYTRDLIKIKVPVPTKAEQTAIATALNDADVLITQLEKLIAKKRAIKQGAMQELLKPKEGWEEKKLGDVFEITAGGDYKKEFSSNAKDDYHIYPIYSNSLSNKGLYGYCTYFSNEPNCITVTARGTIGYSCHRDHNFAAIGRLLILKPKKPVDCFYFTEYINNKIEFVLEVTGVPQLTVPKISQYKVSFPKAKAEQSRIAQILSDMDAEIEALEKKLNKYKMIKQGMMQNLLTGRIRLV